MVNTEWSCAAIDHGLAVFPTGKVGPCCQVAADYLKPISKELLQDPNRFADLRTSPAPSACEKCINAEKQGLPSYRNFFNTHRTPDTKNIAFLDIRNTNQCNLKCRYCGPHFSNQWAKELEINPPLKHVDLDHYIDDILTLNTKLIYFTGGEPLISKDHWDILQHLVNSGNAKNIILMYNTNFTTLKYKDLDIIEIWKQFKEVIVQASIDAVGNLFNNIRSGAEWNKVELNLLDFLKQCQGTKISLSISCVLSILNVWQLDEFIEYFQSRDIKMVFMLLDGPDYFALEVVPDEFKDRALATLDKCIGLLNDPVLVQARKRVYNNYKQPLFDHCMSHVLLLDNVRNEKLFDCLPFGKFVRDRITNNHEYQ